MTGRIGLVLLVLAALAGTASAGGSDPRDPKKRVVASDQAWAKAIQIQHEDLGPGDWRVEYMPKGSVGKVPAGCKYPNLSDLVLTGESLNPNWSRNGSFVLSGAGIWSSKRHAAIAWKRSTDVSIARCMTAETEQTLRELPGLKLKVLSTGRIRIGRLAPRMLTFEMRYRVTCQFGTYYARLAFYAFSRGRANGSLMVISVGRPAQPIPRALERRLAARVAERLRHP